MVTVGMIVRFFVEYYFLIVKGFSKSLFKFIRIFGVDFLGGLILGILLLQLERLNVNNIFISLLIKVVSCGIVYLVYLVITKQINYLLLILPNRFQSIFKR